MQQHIGRQISRRYGVKQRTAGTLVCQGAQAVWQCGTGVCGTGVSVRSCPALRWLAPACCSQVQSGGCGQCGHRRSAILALRLTLSIHILALRMTLCIHGVPCGHRLGLVHTPRRRVRCARHVRIRPSHVWGRAVLRHPHQGGLRCDRASVLLLCLSIRCVVPRALVCACMHARTHKSASTAGMALHVMPAAARTHLRRGQGAHNTSTAPLKRR